VAKSGAGLFIYFSPIHGTDYDAADRARFYERLDRQKHPLGRIEV